MCNRIKIFFVIAALYDGLLGLAFVFFNSEIFNFYGVTPPNHAAYVQFPALLLLIFAAMFMRIAKDPVKNRSLIPYGMGLKASYCALAFGHQATQGIPSMWIPWAWADLAFLVLFTLTWLHLGKRPQAQ